MKQESCILPVECKRCNAVFDLWYDLQTDTDRETIKEDMDLIRAFRESLCWRCRQHVLEGLQNRLDDDDSEEATDEENKEAEENLGFSLILEEN